MLTFFAAVLIPIMILNLVGGIASGLWLAILGEWKPIFIGIVGMFVSHFLLGFLMLPGIIFAAPALVMAEKGKVFLALPFVVLGQLYTYGIIAIWCLVVFAGFMRHAEYNSFIPLVIWSYGVALGPIMYMAQAEQRGGEGGAAGFTTFFAQIAYILIGLIVIFHGATLMSLAVIFSLVMFIGMGLQTVLAMVEIGQNKLKW